jgi:hypothetical protein
MNKFKFSMLSIMMFCGVSGAVHAAEIFDPQAQIAHTKEMIDLANEKEIKSKTLEIAIMQNEINKMNGQSIQASSAQATSGSNPKYESQIAQMQRTIESLKSGDGKAQDTDAFDTDVVFYTGYMQFAGTKQAELIVDGSRKVLSVGEEIYPGLKVKSISESGLVASSKAGDKVFTLKSNAQISQKIYDSAKSKMKSQGGGGFGNAPIKLSSGSDGF